MTYDAEAADRDIERRLAQLLRVWKAQAAARARKARAAERLPFPHTAPRPIQERLIAAVEQAVRSGREPDRGGPDRFRQDGRGPLPGSARGPDLRQAGGLPDVEDPPAEDGRLGAEGHERAGVLARSRSARKSRCAPTIGSSAMRTSAGSRGTTRRRWRARTSSDGCARATPTTTRIPSSRRPAARRFAPSRCSSSSPSEPTPSWGTTTTSSSPASRCGT